MPAQPVSTFAADSIRLGRRPKAFYLTERQSEAIDQLVRAVGVSPRVRRLVEARMATRPDRSTVMRLILQEVDLADDRLAERLVDRMIDR